MPVTYVITFRVVPDRREEFLERLQYVLAEMKSEPAYYEAILHRDPQSENIFMLYETWESPMTLLMSNEAILSAGVA